MSRTGCRRDRVGGPVEAALVDGHDVEVVPGEPDRVFEVGAQDRLVGEAVDRRERFGQRHRRCAPDGVGVERLEHDRPLRAVDGEREQRAGVERRSRHPRSSRRARSMRTPDQIATGAGARQVPVRRGGISDAGGDQPLDVGRRLVERGRAGRPAGRGR